MLFTTGDGGYIPDKAKCSDSSVVPQKVQLNEKKFLIQRKNPGNIKFPGNILVTRWRFELQTHCLKGNCSAN